MDSSSFKFTFAPEGQGRLGSFEEVQQQLANAHENAAKTELALATLRVDYAQLEEDFAKSEADLAKSEQENDILAGKNEKLEVENEVLNSKNDIIDSKLQLLSSKMDNQDAHIDGIFEAINQKIEDRNAQIDKLNARIEDQDAQILHLSDELDTLTSKKDDLDKRHEQLEKEISEYQKRIRSLEADIHNYDDALATMRREKAADEEQIDKLKQAVANEQKANETLDGQLTNAYADLRQKEAEYKKLLQEKDDADDHFLRQQAHNDNLFEQFHQANHRIEALQQVETDLEATQANLDSVLAENEGMRNQLSDHERQINVKDARIQHLEAQVQKALEAKLTAEDAFSAQPTEAPPVIAASGDSLEAELDAASDGLDSLFDGSELGDYDVWAISDVAPVIDVEPVAAPKLELSSVQTTNVAPVAPVHKLEPSSVQTTSVAPVAPVAPVHKLELSPVQTMSIAPVAPVQPALSGLTQKGGWGNFHAHIRRDDRETLVKAQENFQRMGGAVFRPEMRETFVDPEGQAQDSFHAKPAVADTKASQSTTVPEAKPTLSVTRGTTADIAPIEAEDPRPALTVSRGTITDIAPIEAETPKPTLTVSRGTITDNTPTLTVSCGTITDIAPVEVETPKPVFTVSRGTITDIAPVEVETPKPTLTVSCGTITDIAPIEATITAAAEGPLEYHFATIAHVAPAEPIEPAITPATFTVSRGTITDIAPVEAETREPTLTISCGTMTDIAPVEPIVNPNPTIVRIVYPAKKSSIFGSLLWTFLFFFLVLLYIRHTFAMRYATAGYATGAFGNGRLLFGVFPIGFDIGHDVWSEQLCRTTSAAIVAFEEWAGVAPTPLY